MNTSRLLVLGFLVGMGQLHGHEIMKRTSDTRAEAWSSVRVGSIYHALNRMEQEGLVRAVRTERSGRRPERTIYEITESGRAEFSALLQEGLHHVGNHGTDPLNVALSVLDGASAGKLSSIIDARLDTLRAERDRYVMLREKMLAEGAPTVAVAILQHAMRQAEGEVKWHEDLSELAPKIISETKSRTPMDGAGDSKHTTEHTS